MGLLSMDITQCLDKKEEIHFRGSVSCSLVKAMKAMIVCSLGYGYS
jgi:hypothetical protein